MSSYRVLTSSQVDQFIAVGYVRLEEAFPRRSALAVQDFLWTKLAERGFLKNDPATWTEPLVHIKEVYQEPVFHPCSTERLADAVEDLVGRGRWRYRGHPAGWGWWPVNFSLGSDQPWTVPTRGWHWDGQHFRHAVTAPDQGLLLLPHFSEVRRHGGGTVVAGGSHEIVARLLSEYPEGVEHPVALRRCPQEHPWLRDLMGLDDGKPSPETRVQRLMETATIDGYGTSLQVSEVVADPGDVFLCHPFLYHAASQNHSGRARFMCNRTTPLKEPMRLERADGDYSPVEISIRQALNRRAA